MDYTDKIAYLNKNYNISDESLNSSKEFSNDMKDLEITEIEEQNAHTNIQTNIIDLNLNNEKNSLLQKYALNFPVIKEHENVVKNPVRVNRFSHKSKSEYKLIKPNDLDMDLQTNKNYKHGFNGLNKKSLFDNPLSRPSPIANLDYSLNASENDLLNIGNLKNEQKNKNGNNPLFLKKKTSYLVNSPNSKIHRKIQSIVSFQSVPRSPKIKELKRTETKYKPYNILKNNFKLIIKDNLM